MKNDTRFKNIVGQKERKRELGFYLDAYPYSRRIPNMLWVGPKGNGKTTLVRELAKQLVQFDEHGKVMMVPHPITGKMVEKKKPFLEINASGLTLKSFLGTIIQPFVHDKDVTLFIDEASKLHDDIVHALLTILAPNDTHRTQYTKDEYTFEFDFRRQTWLFATAESQKLEDMLVDRLERMVLEEYTLEELGEIVQKSLPDVVVKDDVLSEVSTVLRGNARAANKMAGKIQLYLKGSKLFTKQDWNKLKKILSIYPLGLDAAEVNLLRLLAQTPEGRSLTALSADTGNSRGQIQLGTEKYLLKHHLMEVSTTGRVITAQGQQYLKDLDKCAAS